MLHHIAVQGTGLVGARVARELCDRRDVELVPLLSGSPERRMELAEALGPKIGNHVEDEFHTVVLCLPEAQQVAAARKWLSEGKHVVATAAGGRTVSSLLDLDTFAREHGVSVTVGAGMAPGLSTVLAHHAAALFDEVTTIHLASVGSSGPECLRDLESSIALDGRERKSGAWEPAPSKSGRELVWFAEPLGSVECQRGDLGDTQLVDRVVPGTTDLTVRVATQGAERAFRNKIPTRRRVEEQLGGLRVEVTGMAEGVSSSVVYGLIDRRSVASAALACFAAVEVPKSGALGAGGVTEWLAPVEVLRWLFSRGVKAAVFEAQP